MTKRYIAGHTGLVGSALLRRWPAGSAGQLVVATRQELDLCDSRAVEAWLASKQPEEVVIAAGKVGGIAANANAPATFLYENLMVEVNLIHGSWKVGVQRLLNFGSSCMYPKYAPQPLRPEDLMTGKLEATSEAYAVAKLAGLSLCASYNRQHGTRFITAIPCTVYGPADHFDPEQAHVLPALLRRFHDAKQRGERQVTLWGSGEPRREFLYVDDLAEACELLLRAYEGAEPVNIGSGESHPIRKLAALAAEVVGFEGTVAWDTVHPDGTPEKLLDSSAVRALGWSPRTDLRTGLERTYRWFCTHESGQRTKEPACASS